MEKEMCKTRVDDMLIQMIEPKIKQIEGKFSNNEPLTQEDINTLLLKSQYNHINHLDQKLDEVVEDVASLKDEFTGLKGEFTGLKGEFTGLKGEFNVLRSEFNVLKADIQTTIEKALNRNMMKLIIVIGAFMTLSKLIDKF